MISFFLLEHYIIVRMIFQFLIVALVWLGIMLILQRINFQETNGRKTEIRGETKEIRAKQIEYHNVACYKTFEFFIKIAIAVLGGIAYLSIQNHEDFSGLAEVLMYSGAWLLFLTSLVLSAVLVIHQKSKIERWKRRYVWYQALMWEEFWLIQGMLLLAVGLLCYVLPAIMRVR